MYPSVEFSPWWLTRAYLIILFSCTAALGAYGPDGRCGVKFDGALCDPTTVTGAPCCSKSGFCGSTDAYCLIENGCQLNCTNGTPNPLPSSNSSPRSAPFKLSTAQLTGIIVGAFLFLTILVALGFWAYKIRQKRAAKKEELEGRQTHEFTFQDPNGNKVTYKGEGLQASNHALNLAVLTAAGGNATQLALGGGNPSRPALTEANHYTGRPRIYPASEDGSADGG